MIGETRQTVDEACVEARLLAADPRDRRTRRSRRRPRLPSPPRSAAVSNSTTTMKPDDLDVTDVVELGERLLAHPLTRAVLAAVGDRSRSWPEALAEINTRANSWGRASLTQPAKVERALGRYLWLLSLARRRQGTRLRPLFSVEVQLWMREVSRLLRRVSPNPSFRWLDSAIPGGDELDVPPVEGEELPAIYCRRCGLSGWMALQSEIGDTLLTKPATIYQQALRPVARPSARLLLASPDDPNVALVRPAVTASGRLRRRGHGPRARHADRRSSRSRTRARRATSATASASSACRSQASPRCRSTRCSAHPTSKRTNASCSPSPTPYRTPHTGRRSSAGRTHRFNLRTQTSSNRQRTGRRCTRRPRRRAVQHRRDRTPTLRADTARPRPRSD